MDIDNYLKFKLSNAKNHIFEKFGDKRFYSFEDCMDLLKEFGNPFETTLENASNFIPSKGNDFTSIEAFTKGFIKSDNYKIIVLLLENHFELFVLALDKNFIESYYSLNINNKVLDICYYLEIMCNNK